MESKFEFYEIVRVVSKSPKLKKIYGTIGPVLAKSQDEKGFWYYGVSLNGKGRFVAEDDIESTGKFMDKEQIYKGDRVSVLVDREGVGKKQND